MQESIDRSSAEQLTQEYVSRLTKSRNFELPARKARDLFIHSSILLRISNRDEVSVFLLGYLIASWIVVRSNKKGTKARVPVCYLIGDDGDQRRAVGRNVGPPRHCRALRPSCAVGIANKTIGSEKKSLREEEKVSGW